MKKIEIEKMEKDELYEKWLESLKNILKQRDIDKKALAQYIGVTVAHLNSILAIRRRASNKAIELICNYLGLSYTDFFKSGGDNISYKIPEKINKIIPDLMQLTDEKLPMLETFVKFLLQDKKVVLACSC